MSDLQQASLTFYELRLLQALRAEPNRVAMWATLGDPARHHRDILGLYLRLMHLCNARGIEYWLAYDSLLGYVRHRGVLPWEWNMAIGCTAAHYARLRALGVAKSLTRSGRFARCVPSEQVCSLTTSCIQYAM